MTKPPHKIQTHIILPKLAVLHWSDLVRTPFRSIRFTVRSDVTVCVRTDFRRFRFLWSVGARPYAMSMPLTARISLINCKRLRLSLELSRADELGLYAKFEEKRVKPPFDVLSIGRVLKSDGTAQRKVSFSDVISDIHLRQCLMTHGLKCWLFLLRTIGSYGHSQLI